MNEREALGLFEAEHTVPLPELIKKRLDVVFRNRRLWCVVLINVIFFSFFLYMCLNTGLYADDYGYRYVFDTGSKLTNNRVDSLAEVISSQMAHYRLMNGRSVAHFLLQFFLIWDRRVFSTVNSVMYCLLGVGLYLHTLSAKDRKRGRHRPFSQLAVYLIPWMMFPVFGSVFHIECLAANYLWTMTIIIWFLLPYRLLLDGHDIFSGIPLAGTAIMLLTGVIAGWCSENGSAVALLLIGCMGLYYLIERKSFPFWCAAGFAGALAGFVMMLLAPGYRIRSEKAADTSVIDRVTTICSLHTLMPYGCIIIILLICVCFLLYSDLHRKRKDASRFASLFSVITVIVFILNMAFSATLVIAYIDLILCAAAAALIVRQIKSCPPKRIRADNLLPLCYFTAAFCANLVLAAVPYIEQRSQLPFLLLLTVSAAMITERTVERLGRRVRIYGLKPVFIAFLLIYSIVSLTVVSVKTHNDYLRFLEMEQSIYNQRAAGVTDITLKKPDLCGDRRVADFWMDNNDPDYWINQAFCQYYDIDSVHRES